MHPDDLDVDALLESVARREAVDWDAAEARATSGVERSRVRALRDVERLAAFHHSLQHDVARFGDTREVGRWGDLLLLEKVGSGSNGDVYRAWDPALQREVALKLMHAPAGASRNDWLEEARALARIRDPHVVAVYGAGEHDGWAGLWMEFLRGPSLEHAIARSGPLSSGLVARLGVQIGQALAAAHGAGTLHRDVKPANIVLESEASAVLTDFGLGQRRAAERGGAFAGTPLFMSPQRLAGAAAKPTDDLYALGVTLWCALAGRSPFGAETLEQLRAETAKGPARSLSAERPYAPPPLVAAIERAMAPEPAARFESATALVAAFESARAGIDAGGDSPARVESLRGTPASEPGAGRPSRSRRATPWLLGAVLVVALGLFLFAHPPRSGTPGGDDSRRAARSGPDAIQGSHDQAATTAPGASSLYDVSATFLKRGAGGDTPLAAGDRVGPGDRLSLEFRSTRPAWVYVLDADERGEVYLLFPQPLFDRANPLPRESTVVLPGTRKGRDNAWIVTSRGGHEHLLVVASPAPVAELEADLARLPAVSPGRPVQYARVEPATIQRLRGIGGVGEVTAAPPASGPAAIFEQIRSLAGREQGVRGTWVRQVVLDNPLH